MESEAPPESPHTASPVPQTIPPLIHAVCGWPFVLVAVGGAVGAGLGAIAYVVSMNA